MARISIVAAAFFGLTGVILGALASHALKSRLPAERLASFDTATKYQLFHALLLLGLGLLAQHAPGRWLNLATWSAIGGIVLFSGSIYILVLGGPRWLGPITPLGGLLLIFAWLALGLHAYFKL